MEFQEKPPALTATPTQSSERFVNKLLQTAQELPIQTMMTAGAIAQMGVAIITFASGNKDAAYTRALSATIQQVTALGLMGVDFAVRKRAK